MLCPRKQFYSHPSLKIKFHCHPDLELLSYPNPNDEFEFYLTPDQYIHDVMYMCTNNCTDNHHYSTDEVVALQLLYRLQKTVGGSQNFTAIF